MIKRLPQLMLSLIGIALLYPLFFTAPSWAAAQQTPPAVFPPFDIISTNPGAGAFFGVTLTSTVQATFNAPVNLGTVDANRFVVHGSQHGQLSGAFSYNSGNNTVTFTPAGRFHFGETISVIGTSGIQDANGVGLTPYQWQFTAGYRFKRCMEGFLPNSANLTPVWSSAADWGDFDKDGDLDLVLAGKSSGNPITRIYRNDGAGNFTNANITLPGLREGSAAWGDYDKDGDLDLLLTGANATGQYTTRLYRSEGGTSFSDISTLLPGVRLGSAIWVDYDNDGDLDIFIHGDSLSGSIARLYRNSGGDSFIESGLSFTGVNNSAADWADYDNDGDPDLLLTGDSANGLVTLLYANNGSSFTVVTTNLPNLRDSAVAWKDYDNDGDEDLLLSGETSRSLPAPITRLYRNDGGNFTDLNAGLLGVLDGAASWADFDNDGDFDLLVSGKDAIERLFTVLYKNNGGTFVRYPANLPAMNLGTVAWADVDGDYDADLLVAGLITNGIVTGVYHNYDCPADVSITQRITPDKVNATQPVTITLRITNAGPVTATGVIVQDPVPSQLTNLQVITSTSSSGIRVYNNSGAGTPFTWSISDLAMGQGATITVTGLIAPTAGEVYTNTATVTARKDITLTNNTTTQLLMAPFHIVQSRPTGGAMVGASLTEAVILNFDAALAPATVTSQHLALYGSQSGLLGQASADYSINARRLTVRTDRAFAQGEVVTVVASDQLKSVAGAPLNPYQYQFVAGRMIDRCVGDFKYTPTPFPNVEHGAVAWGDYDQDGDADLLLAGDSGQGMVARIYQNQNGSFTDAGVALPGVRHGTVAWVDFDGDGDLDAFINGDTGASRLTVLYRNDATAFTLFEPGFVGVSNSVAAWADYNNDGRLDLAISGESGSGRATYLYRNDGAGTFTLISTALPGIADGVLAWGDYDRDADLDLLISGTGDGGRVTTLYRNTMGTFAASDAVLTALSESSASWGDYDKDGDLDLVMAGNSAGGRVTLLYNNSGGVFSPVASGLPAVANGTLAWGDFDNNNVLDLFLSGATDSGVVAGIYYFVGGSFTEFAAGLQGVTNSAATWGDIDNDLDLDLVVLGHNGSAPSTRLYRNMNCISDVAITKLASTTSAQPGQTITYTVRFVNQGPQPARNVQVTDLLPADLLNVQIKAISASAGVVVNQNGAAPNLAWQVSDLQLNQGAIITMTATLADGAPGSAAVNQAGISATHDITLTNNSATVVVGRPYHITQTVPALAKAGVRLNAPIQATFDADVDPATLSTQSFLVYGEQSGLRSGNFGYDSVARTLTFTPTTRLHHGESVNVIGTTALRSAAGAQLLPYQWHFIAGKVDRERCLAGFGQVDAGLPGLLNSAAAWGDYDGDGDLDLALAGAADGVNAQTKLYRNIGNGNFADSGVALAAVQYGALAWGDYDQDGDLDLVVTGASAGQGVAKLYTNTNGAFAELNAALTGVSSSDAAWGDYDNDGDLDLVITGTPDGTTPLTRLYRNQQGTFTPVTTALTNVAYGSVLWGDYDQDHDLDLLLTGTTSGPTVVSQIFRNDGGTFVNSGVALPGVTASDGRWGDYDGDGDLDLVLAGLVDASNRLTRLYRNDSGSFIAVTTPNFPNLSYVTLAWGDYDNDSDLDLLLSGTPDGTTAVTQILANGGSDSFTLVNSNIAAVSGGSATWNDFDGDRDLDLFLIGNSGSGAQQRLYRNRDCTSDLSLTKQVAPASVLPGELITYTITFQNSGPQPATRVVLTDILPLNLLSEITVNSTVPLTVSGNSSYVWHLPEIAAGSGGTVVVHGRTTFAATGTTITNTATIQAREDVTATNNVGVAAVVVRAPELVIDATALTVRENEGNVTVEVRLTEPNYAGDVTVNYAAAPVVRQLSSGFADISGVLTIPAGQTSVALVIPVIDDQLNEADEAFQLMLNNPQGAVLSTKATLRLNIVDNDPRPTLGVSGVTVSEAEGVANFVLTLSAPSGRTVSAVLNTLDATARAGEDYVALVNQTVTFEPGITTATIPVTLLNDNLRESSEEFYLVISPIQNADLPAGQVSAIIQDNDGFGIYLPVVLRGR